MRMMIARRRARAMRVFRMRDGSSIAATKASAVNSPTGVDRGDCHYHGGARRNQSSHGGGETGHTLDR
jgi:hypothetical protein